LFVFEEVLQAKTSSVLALKKQKLVKVAKHQCYNNSNNNNNNNKIETKR